MPLSINGAQRSALVAELIRVWEDLEPELVQKARILNLKRGGERELPENEDEDEDEDEGVSAESKLGDALSEAAMLAIGVPEMVRQEVKVSTDSVISHMDRLWANHSPNHNHNHNPNPHIWTCYGSS